MNPEDQYQVYGSISQKPDQKLQMILPRFKTNNNDAISSRNEREIRIASDAIHQPYVLMFLEKNLETRITTK